MSTSRRLFDDPRNTETQGTRVVQKCCDGNAPYWDTHRIRDWEDAWDDSDRNMTANRQSDSILVQDDTGASDNDVEILEFDINGRVVGSNDKMKGYVRVEGPNSGYRPDFISQTEWMNWQGVEWSSNPLGVKMANGQYNTSLPNPPRWRRTRIRTDKVRWGKGVKGWGAYDWTFLWCQKCETALESAWSDTLDALPLIARGVAMIVSNIPVIGTAISFVIHAGVSLAEGKSIDDATLDAIGGALPGNPTSGMVFRAGVAIAKGERIDRVIIKALPIPPEMQNLLIIAADVVYGIASGENVTKIAYDQIRKQLPPQAQQAMDVARRVINGENVPNMILTAAEQVVVEKVRAEANRLIQDAQAQGGAALAKAKEQAESLKNQYAAETGYQIALTMLPTWERDSISAGLAAGAMSKPPVQYSFGTVPEKNVAVNETYLQKGQRIIAAGARYKGRLLSDILAKGPLVVDVQNFDALNGVWRTDKMTYKVGLTLRGPFEGNIDDAWRRGFTIAIGVCEGMSERGPGQLAVYQTLAEAGGRSGFDAGQAVQYHRTLKGEYAEGTFTEVAKQSSAIHSLLSLVDKPVPPPPSTATQSVGLPTMVVIAQPRTQAITMDPQVYAQKTADRGRWVEYYKNLV